MSRVKLSNKVWQNPVYFIAFGFGSGLMPAARPFPIWGQNRHFAKLRSRFNQSRQTWGRNAVVIGN